MSRNLVTETSDRTSREEKTINLMIQLYCNDHHATEPDFCPECAGLQQYAKSRLMRCPFAPEKPTCARCPVHCYRPEMRERIRQVMRYSGPRMLWLHPIRTIRHLLDGMRKSPSKPGQKQ